MVAQGHNRCNVGSTRGNEGHMEVAAPQRQVLPAEIPEQEDLDLKETPKGLPSSTVVIIRSRESMTHQQSKLMTGSELDFPVSFRSVLASISQQ